MQFLNFSSNFSHNLSNFCMIALASLAQVTFAGKNNFVLKIETENGEKGRVKRSW